MTSPMFVRVAVVFSTVVICVGQPNNSDTVFTTLPVTVPQSQYTPHGYIDNPYHSMVFNRSGVIRSVPPLGFGFWCTDFKGAYGSGVGGHVNYLSLLNFGVAVDGKQFFSADDFANNGVDLYSAYHTKHMVSYDWTTAGCTFSIKYFLPRENSLAAIVEIENTSASDKDISVYAVHTYQIGQTKWWGSNGLSASYNQRYDCSVTKIWAYGDVFALGSSLHSSSHTYSRAGGEIHRGIAKSETTATDKFSVVGLGPLNSIHRYSLLLPPQSKRSFLVVLSRNKNKAWAIQELQTALQESRLVLQYQLQIDEVFWRECPMLTGDWGEHWKHGWVYDFETLRMNVRQPVGIFKHPWDAMQIHSPRLVLGETALDMMTLSYANPELAKKVIYGTFADALAPNIPCVREDGSVNMISSDGSECGTAPMWGYPFRMIKNIFLATADTLWIRQLYPRLQSYIEWWLKNRTDSEGWLHCNNSWESGQDGSRRFLVAEHNEAAVADFVRTVDVEASMAEAMLVMKYFATVLGKADAVKSWELLAQQRINNTRSMFVENWFRDVDARTKKPIILDNHYDVAMLAPLTCGIASEEQVRAVRPMLKKFEGGHEWPPGLFTLAEAAWVARERVLAAEGVASVADRVYRRIDSRRVMFYDSTFSYRIPGVANEFWPTREIPAGGENYGWGATLPMNIIRNIIGFREKESDTGVEMYLAPTLPKSFLKVGKRYSISHLKYRNVQFDVSCTVSKSNALSVSLRVVSETPVTVSVQSETGKIVAAQKKSSEAMLTFSGENSTQYIIRFE
ncbi:MAG: trehalase family glycosidase [Bacteroidota bacterium]